MNNAELFKKVFGMWAEEFWAYPTEDMLNWLTSDAPGANDRDLIREAIETLDDAKGSEEYHNEYEDGYNDGIDFAISTLFTLLPVQSKTSRIENALHGKTAEEQYEFIKWLLHDYGMWATDTRTAVIEWLEGEDNNGRSNQQTSGD